MKGTNLAVVCSASGLPQNVDLTRPPVWCGVVALEAEEAMV